MLPAGYLLFVFVLILKSLTKIKKMKKVLFVLALGAFAACGSGENKEAVVDSPKVEATAPIVDSPVAPVVDSPKVDSPAVAK